jgi:hypothetical protein
MTSRKPSQNYYWLAFPLKENHSKNKFIWKHYIIIFTVLETVNIKGELIGPLKPVLATAESNISANSKIYAKHGFSPWIRGIVWWNKLRVENLETRIIKYAYACYRSQFLGSYQSWLGTLQSGLLFIQNNMTREFALNLSLAIWLIYTGTFFFTQLPCMINLFFRDYRAFFNFFRDEANS